jgi:adenosine deaminase
VSRRRGLGVGPENIRIALGVLGAERIDHGVAIAEDADLVQRAAAERIPLTVCPTSNVVIANRYATLVDHPLRALRDAGVLVTINTDDPAMMELDLGEEYRRVAAALGFTADELAELAIDGIASTFLDPVDQASLEADFRDGLDAIPDRT